MIRAAIAALFRQRSILDKDRVKTIMQAKNVQSWFQRERGTPMGRAECQRCARTRVFTIWIDGTYRCIPCLFGRNFREFGDADPMEVSERTMREFMAEWQAYRARHEAEEGSESALSIASGLWNLELFRERRPLICVMGACERCGGFRPFMPAESGDAGCIHCLMQGRTVELEIEVVDDHAAG